MILPVSALVKYASAFPQTAPSACATATFCGVALRGGDIASLLAAMGVDLVNVDLTVA
jgi:hypothetical protein